MLKERTQLFELLFLLCDLLVVSAAWVLAYWLRFYVDFIPVEKGVPPFRDYLPMVIFIWVIWGSVFRQAGLYRSRRGQEFRKEFLLLLNANTLAVLIFVAVTYFFREKSVPFSRLVFVYFWLISFVGVLLERAILREILKEIRRRGYNLRYMLIIGDGQLAQDVARRIRNNKELGIQVIGCVSKDGSSVGGVLGIPVVGSYDDIDRVLKRLDVDQVVVALPLEDLHLLPQTMNKIGDSLVDVKIVPDICGFAEFGNSIEEFEGLPVITLRSSPLEGINLLVKRTADIFIASLAIIVLFPVMLLIAVLVKLTSKGPVFYTQERVSLDGTRFTIYKFRTMRIDAERNGPGWTRENDSRVTPFGRFLRRYSLDELPQFFNVLKGDMSIVGPRPERPVFIEEFRQRIPRYMLRHKVPAGITGWAQINGWRGDTSIEKRIEHDLYYIQNWSLWFDLKILFLTIFKGFRNKNAY